MNDFRPEEKDAVYIGEGVSIKGAIQATETVVVDGSVEGEVACAQLIVGPNGVVTGTITVSEADIYGKIGSDISVKELMTVRASGRVEGKWTYGEIEVEKGGVLLGTAESTEFHAERATEFRPERPAEFRSERKSSAREEKPVQTAYKRPELIVSEAPPPVEEPRVASMAARALRERKKL